MTSGDMIEGYVKYRNEHHSGPAPAHPDLAALDALRTELFDAGLVGQLPDGIGFGNMSVRAEHGFIVTATATGGARELGPDGYTLVTDWDAGTNIVVSCGPLPPSSEALTHGAVYRASAAARCVVHVHSRELFDVLSEQGGSVTPPEAAFGTPALAFAVESLVRQWPQEGVLVLSGHEEGLLLYGPSVAAVGALVQALPQPSRCACGGQTVEVVCSCQRGKHG